MENRKTYIWCLHCGRVFYGVFSRPHPMEFLLGGKACEYSDCDGGVRDFVLWKEIREMNPEYPAVPVKYVVYPMYGGTGYEVDGVWRKSFADMKRA